MSNIGNTQNINTASKIIISDVKRGWDNEGEDKHKYKRKYAENIRRILQGKFQRRKVKGNRGSPQKVSRGGKMSERDTIILTHKELKYLLIDSLKQYSEDITYISGNNPYAFSINKKIVNIFIHNLHESGSGRLNQDECRIQVSKSSNFLEAKSSGKPVLFLGYFADSNIFTAWNPFVQTERINTRKTISLYSRFSIQKKASEKGISAYVDNDKQSIISFKPEYLGLYIENFKEMHLSDEDTLFQLIKQSDSTEETEKEIGHPVTSNENYLNQSEKKKKLG